MRKVLSVAVAAALILTMLIPAMAMAAVDYSYIRVRLDSMNHPTSVQFKLAGAYRIAEAPSVDLYPKITYTLKTDTSGLKLTYNNGAGTVSVSLPSKITLVQYSNGSSSNYLYMYNLTNGWRYYSGSMAVRHIKDSANDYLEFVNNVFIETYLYGVVSCEMGNDWPAEALKAQAVCARTYAMAYIRSRQDSAYSYDVVDTTSNQVYKGYPFGSNGAPLSNVISAVDATRGKAIVLGDPALLNFADGMYSASNGGQVRTLSMKYSGATDTYHVFKEDPYDLKNTASPAFKFIFPIANNAATMSLLSNTTDKNKVNDMLALIKEKLPEALRQKGIACTESTGIVINGVKSVVPVSPRPGVPATSREYTELAVTVSVKVSGATSTAPVEEVLGNGIEIANGATTPSLTDDTDFGSATAGAQAAVQKTYTIINTGSDTLAIDSIATDSADFTVDQSTVNQLSIAAGSSAAFAVSFHPAAVGDSAATVTIRSNDAAHDPFTFSVKGTGINQQVSLPSANLKAAQPADISGGGGMPDDVTCDVTVNLAYLTEANDGAWNVPGELRTRFTKYSSLLNGTNLWELYQSSDSNFLYITVRGYGHGVGMSQRGAQEMANEQKSYTDILDFYFNNTAGKSAIATVPVKQKTLSAIPGKGKSAVYYLVNVSSLNIRADMSTKALTVASLPRNTIVEVLSTSKSWSRVLYAAKGIVGYASTTYLKKTAQTPTPAPSPTPTHTSTTTPTGSTATPSPTTTASQVMGKVLANALYIRSQPNTSSSIVYDHLNKDDEVIILDKNAAENWYKVKYAAYTGYSMYQSGDSVYIEILGSPPTTDLQPVKATANVTDFLTMRSSASTSAADIGHILKNDTFTVLQVDTTASWLKVFYSGKTGFVLAKYAIIGGSADYSACTVTVDSLNVRQSADGSSAVVGKLAKDDTVVVTAVVTVSSVKWYKIKYGSLTAYINATYARISSKT